jgi:hypothetical protein
LLRLLAETWHVSQVTACDERPGKLDVENTLRISDEHFTTELAPHTSTQRSTTPCPENAIEGAFCQKLAWILDIAAKNHLRLWRNTLQFAQQGLLDSSY